MAGERNGPVGAATGLIVERPGSIRRELRPSIVGTHDLLRLIDTGEDMLADDLRESRVAKQVLGAKLVSRREAERVPYDGVLIIQAGRRRRIADIRTSDIRIRRAIDIGFVDVDIDLVTPTKPTSGAAIIVLMVNCQHDGEAIVEEAL